MKYKNDEYRAREGGALKAAQNLARHTCYRTFGDPAITPPQLQDALQVPQENLFLLPSGGDYPYGLEKAVLETRCKLLIIEPGSTMDGSHTFYFTLLRCAEGEARRHRALRLWLQPEGTFSSYRIRKIPKLLGPPLRSIEVSARPRRRGWTRSAVSTVCTTRTRCCWRLEASAGVENWHCRSPRGNEVRPGVSGQVQERTSEAACSERIGFKLQEYRR